MENKKSLCKIFDCCDTKILYNGFDNTLSELDSELQNVLGNEDNIYNNQCFEGVSCEYDIGLIKLKSSGMLRHVVFSLTEDCNFRCKYCGYHDNRFSSETSPKSINEATLVRALDFIIIHSSEGCDTLISFYGGEPLLKLDSIKFAIAYLEKKNHWGHKFYYRLTTNGTLLKGNVVDYLVSKDVTCTISLDGPAYLHDRYRVYKDNKPTYSDIIENVKHIAKKYPQYYKNNIRFNTVISPPFNRLIPKSYFEKSNVFRIDVSIGDYFRDILNTEHGISPTDLIDNNTHIVKINFSSDEILKDMNFIETMKKYMCIGIKDERKFIFPSGFCNPLVKRIHIGVDGKLMLCERVDEKNPNFHFGNVFDGYNYEKIDLLYRYTNKILEGNCNKCWAFRFCDACFATLDKIEYDGDYCKKFRKYAERGITNYLNLKFYNKRFDSIMNSISTD